MFRALAAAALRAMPIMNSWHIANVMWSMTIVQVMGGRVRGGSERHVRGDVDTGRIHCVCTFSSSF